MRYIKLYVMNAIIFTSPLTLKQYALRPISPDKTAALYKLTIQEKDRLRQTLPWLHRVTQVNDTMTYARESQLLREQGQAMRFVIAPVEPVDQEPLLIGVISLEQLHTPTPRFGYWIAKECEGCGIITAAVKEIVKKVFRETNISRVYIHVGVDNNRSQNVARRLNFKFERIIPNAENLYGTWVDHKVFVLDKMDCIDLWSDAAQHVQENN